jgi:hypothetical protein
MNLKKILFSLSIIATLSTAHAQENKSVIKDLAHKMFVDVLNKDFDAIIDMTHPKVFDIAPKEQIREVFKMTFEGNDEFSIEIFDKIPEYKVSKIFKGAANNLEYAFVSYDMKMKMTFNNQEFDDESKKMMTSMMKAQGMDINFISDSAMDVLLKDSLTIMLKEDATNNQWVMVNYDADSPLFYQVVSSDLIEKAKEYKQNLMLESKRKSED